MGVDLVKLRVLRVDVGLVSRRGDAAESHRTLADRIRQVGGGAPHP